MKTRPQTADIKFMQGEVDPDNLRRKRILGRDAEGWGRGGSKATWCATPGMKSGDFCGAFEIYRHRPDAVRGTISFLMHQTMQVLQSEGVRHVSLCLVPGMGCNVARPGDSALARWGFVLAAKYLGFLFDTAGMYHFKSRFRPRFESRYICVRPKITIGSSLAFLQILGVFNVDLGKLCRSVWEHMRKSVSRTTLASLDAASLQTVTAEVAPESNSKTKKQRASLTRNSRRRSVPPRAPRFFPCEGRGACSLSLTTRRPGAVRPVLVAITALRCNTESCHRAGRVAYQQPPAMRRSGFRPTGLWRGFPVYRPASGPK